MMAKKRIEKIRQEATDRVNKDPFVQFRIEPSLLDQLIKVANDKGAPVGALTRMWVVERLKREQKRGV